MKIKIVQHVRKGNEYAHYPEQILVDHSDEKFLLESGKAVPVPGVQAETAKLPKAETRKSK